MKTIKRYFALIIILLLLIFDFMTACPTIPVSRGAYFSGTNQPGFAIIFSGAGSYDTDLFFGSNTPYWRWDFDYNGTFTVDVTTTSAYPTWTYTQAGTYTVAVQYIDDDGQAGAIYTFQITISGLKRLYYVKDHLGSIRATVDSTGNIVSYDDYDPWGMQLDGRSANYGSANEKYKFTGKERDVETGLDYFGARYYDSRIGRWMSVDPLAEKYPNLSPYNYAANNPVLLFDPNGKWIAYYHNYFLEKAFPSASNLEALKKASAYADENQYQKAEYSYRHAMRAEGESPEEAQKDLNNFLNSKDGFDPNTGTPWDENINLGVRLHALMDFLCPSHEGFQEWPKEKLEQDLKYTSHFWGDVDWSNDRNNAIKRALQGYADAYKSGRRFNVYYVDATNWSTDQINSAIANWKRQGYLVIVDGVAQ